MQGYRNINEWGNWATAATSATAIIPIWWNQTAVTVTSTTTNLYWPVYTTWQMYQNVLQHRVLTQPVTPGDTEQARRNRAAAAARAREMLMTFLDESQRAEFDESRSFVFVGKRNRYRITPGRIANIEVLSPRRNRLLRRLCVHPEDYGLPVEDIMLSQLLHLRADEDRLIQTANIHPA